MKNRFKGALPPPGNHLPKRREEEREPFALMRFEQAHRARRRTWSCPLVIEIIQAVLLSPQHGGKTHLIFLGQEEARTHRQGTRIQDSVTPHQENRHRTNRQAPGFIHSFVPPQNRELQEARRHEQR
jgi:hypothetical protein